MMYPCWMVGRRGEVSGQHSPKKDGSVYPGWGVTIINILTIYIFVSSYEFFLPFHNEIDL